MYMLFPDACDESFVMCRVCVRTKYRYCPYDRFNSYCCHCYCYGYCDDCACRLWAIATQHSSKLSGAN